MRRDFTINGLLFDPIGKTILDYVSGQKDIEGKIVRAIGEPARRFDEDKLRILRAIRFGARLGYTIESETWKAVCVMAPQIHQVSIERIQGEIVRILTEGQARTGFQMLHDSGLLLEILPEVQWNDHLAQCLGMLERGVPSDLAMAVLLHELQVSDVLRIMERLKFSRLEINHTVCLVARIPQFNTVRDMSISALKKFFRLPRFEDHLEIERICRTVSQANLENYDFALETFRGWTPRDIWPKPLITGEDLIAIEIPTGPVYKEILSAVEDEQLEGRITTREAAIEFVKKRFGLRS